MKVFDFTAGTKGKHLGDIKLVGHTGGCLVKKGDSVFRVELARPRGGPDDQWSWCTSAGYTVNGEDVNIDPRDFGVGAVCFCLGEWFHLWHAGHPEAESHWEWKIVGTAEWNRNACKSGILKATKNTA